MMNDVNSGGYDSDQEGAKNGKATADHPIKKHGKKKESEIMTKDRAAALEEARLMRSLTEANRRKMENEAEVRQTIEIASESGETCMDLSQRNLPDVPKEMLKLVQLQHIYLEGNTISQLPDDFFKCYPNLQWLDLRNNLLESLPSIYVGRHKHLKNLLLEGNKLKTLPLEFGLIPTLTGLNICSNPLEFPPPDIIELGTKSILKFLQDMILAKNQGKILERVSGSELENLRVTDDKDSSSDEDIFGHSNSAYMRNRRGSQDSSSDHSDLVGPVPSSAALHRPASYSQLKHQHLEKVRQAGGSGTVEQRKHRKEKLKKYRGREFISPVVDKVEQRFLEEQQMSRIRLEQMRVDQLLQKQRNVAALDDWRDDGKKLQMEKYREAYIYGGAKEPVNIAGEAPFGVYEKHMKVVTNEERIKSDVRAVHEKIRRAMSPRTIMRMEAEKEQKDSELRARIEDHTHKMQQRRRHKNGDPSQEMAAAKRDLEVAEQLHREVAMRRQELEHRFNAFTGKGAL